ncbi:MAG: DUF2796 domain-containing protein [Pseudomonadota bacterium]
MKNPVLVLALMAPNALFAQETRDLGAHEHGHSSLNIAIEGTQIAMELEAPGADIVGFEHEAKTAEDRAKLDAAIAGLSKPLSLFVLPSAAGCTVTSSSAGLIDEHRYTCSHNKVTATLSKTCCISQPISRGRASVLEAHGKFLLMSL